MKRQGTRQLVYLLNMFSYCDLTTRKIEGKVCLYENRYISLFQEENQTTVDVAPKKRISKLDVKIQSLLELICDLKAMEECVLEMKFDTRKAPLGQCDREMCLNLSCYTLNFY